MFYCSNCNVAFASNKGLQQHMKGSRHIDRLNGKTKKNNNTCGNCGKSYSHRQSLHVHRMNCTQPCTPNPTPTPSVTEILEELKNTVLEERKQHQLEREEFKKEQQELRNQISILLDKHTSNIPSSTTNNHNNTNNTNTNNIETQNITININAFGNENTDYIDDKAILACIGRIYNSIPSLLEKIHFDPKHPENHNIKITNKKLPYASVMGNNQKWKTVDRKDAIETMVTNSYNMLDEKYSENKDKISESKQQHFKGFQSKFESEDKELMKQLKTEVDMMVLNGV